MQFEGGPVSDTPPERLPDYDTLLKNYFSIVPYKTEYVGEKKTKIVSDPPTLDGFCGQYNISMEKLADLVSDETFSLCLSKFKHFMVVNGLQGNYESGPWALTMKNLARWADRSETTVKRDDTTGIGLDEAERIIKFLAARRAAMADVTPPQAEKIITIEN